MPPIKLVCTDLDGTLLNAKHAMAPLSVEAVRALKKQGVWFVVATGRPYPDVFAKLKDVGLEPDFIITSNGARVHDKNRHKVFSFDIDATVVKKLFQLTNKDIGWDDAAAAAASAGRKNGPYSDYPEAPRDFTVHLNRRSEGLTTRSLEEVSVAFHPSFQYKLTDPNSVTVDQMRGTHSAWVRGDFPVLEKVKAYVKAHFATSVKAYFALPHLLDICCKPVSKGVALRLVAKRLGVPLDQIVCFGDGMNDIPMMKIAGRAFVMGNAPEYVKKAAPKHAQVIERNTDDGVAKKLFQLFPKQSSL